MRATVAAPGGTIHLRVVRSCKHRTLSDAPQTGGGVPINRATAQINLSNLHTDRLTVAICSRRGGNLSIGQDPEQSAKSAKSVQSAARSDATFKALSSPHTLLDDSLHMNLRQSAAAERRAASGGRHGRTAATAVAAAAAAARVRVPCGRLSPAASVHEVREGGGWPPQAALQSTATAWRMRVTATPTARTVALPNAQPSCPGAVRRCKTHCVVAWARPQAREAQRAMSLRVPPPTRMRRGGDTAPSPISGRRGRARMWVVSQSPRCVSPSPPRPPDAARRP